VRESGHEWGQIYNLKKEYASRKSGHINFFFNVNKMRITAKLIALHTQGLNKAPDIQ
jgi:hypothetical protein